MSFPLFKTKPLYHLRGYVEYSTVDYINHVLNFKSLRARYAGNLLLGILVVLGKEKSPCCKCTQSDVVSVEGAAVPSNTHSIRQIYGSGFILSLDFVRLVSCRLK